MHEQAATIRAFLDATTSRPFLPGSGSAAALAGALAVAMGETVLSQSLATKSLSAFEGELRPALTELQHAREDFLRLIDEGQAARGALNRVHKLAMGHPDRQEKLLAAVAESVRVPQSVATTAVSVLAVCDRTVNFVSPAFLPSLAACADLAMATVRCGAYAVRANIKLVADPAGRRAAESAIGDLLTQAASLIQQVIPRIWARDAQAG